MKALAKLSEREYKQDIVLGNMVEWIMTGRVKISVLFEGYVYHIPDGLEFKKAFKARGDVAFVQHPLTEWNNLNSHARSKFLRGAVKDLPLVSSTSLLMPLNCADAKLTDLSGSFEHSKPFCCITLIYYSSCRVFIATHGSYQFSLSEPWSDTDSSDGYS